MSSIIEDSLSRLNSNVVALTAQILARNEIDSKKLEYDEDREVREYKLKCFLVATICLFGGLKVLEIVGLLK